MICAQELLLIPMQDLAKVLGPSYSATFFALEANHQSSVACMMDLVSLVLAHTLMMLL